MRSAPRSAAAVASSCSKPPPGWARPRCSSTRAALADEAGWLVRRAAPGPLEHHFPFGVVRALLEAPVRESGVGAATARGAPPRASCCWTAARRRGDSTMLIAHSVLWVCSALAEQRPLALVVDDAQWADRAVAGGARPTSRGASRTCRC